MGGRFIASIGSAAVAAGVAVLGSLGSARAEAALASYVRPPETWREIAPGEAPVRFGDPAPILKIFVNDGWISRYQIEADFADGGLVRYEKPSHAYASGIPLQRVFYQIYGHDEILAGHGINLGIGDAVIATIAGRPVAYLARQGKDATCFAFVSQFGVSQSGTPQSGTGAGSRDRMLNGAVCRPLGEGNAEALAQRWLALIERIVVP